MIRVYDKDAPLNSQVYAVGGPLAVPAGGMKSTTVDSARPFASAAAQIQQIDNLVDYGPPQDGSGAQNIVQHLAGHAVYTRPEWMLFHAEATARWLYGETAAP